MDISTENSLWDKITDRYGYEISNSLKRSKVRTRSLMDVGNHPDKTILQISWDIRITYANTYGAIIGDGKKYSIKLSLTGLNLMLYEKYENSNGHGGICNLTDTGKGVFEILNGRIDRL